MLTGELVSFDWLRYVMRGGVACGSSNQRHDTHRCKLTRLQWLLGASMDRRISYRLAVDLDARVSLVVRSA